MPELERIETGPLRVDDDWCGVFVRGDSAFAYSLAVEALLNAAGPLDPMSRMMVEGLRDLLRSCDERAKPTPTVIDRRTRYTDFLAGAQFAWSSKEGKTINEAFQEHISHAAESR